jgi:membrane protease YdiL (CAAX protease family)
MISLIILLILIGVALYFVGFIPMDARILQIVRALVILIAIILVLSWLFPGYMPREMRHWQ